ncbi:MAG: hypothetical protein R3B57_03755 [Phycisphaerales bacterium]
MKLFLASMSVGVCACAASASVVTLAEFALNDHPGGNLVPPSYALRLDHAFGISNLTFSADTYHNATLVVTQDMNSGQYFIDIAGTFHGGEDTGSGWNNPFDLEVDFHYEVNVAAIADGWEVNGFSALNNGTITRLDTMVSQTWYGLEDVNGDNGPAGDVFKLAADGWRIDGDNDTWVGRGWLTPNSDGSHIAGGGSQDWIFVAKEIPAPSGVALLGLAGLAATRRRR